MVWPDGAGVGAPPTRCRDDSDGSDNHQAQKKAATSQEEETSYRGHDGLGGLNYIDST